MRRNDVTSTSFRRRVPTRFLINQCQIITFLILKYDIIENSRIELRGIVLPVQVGGLLGGGGAKFMLPPPSQIIGGGGAWPPLAPLFLRLCCIVVCVYISSLTQFAYFLSLFELFYLSHPMLSMHRFCCYIVFAQRITLTLVRFAHFTHYLFITLAY